MLISHSLSLIRVLRFTWKVDLLMIVACTAVYYMREYLIPRSIQIPAAVATLLGTALAFFIGFNNNQAYDRWWEARIIWGALVNDSRTYTRNILKYTAAGTLGREELLAIQKRMIFRQISFVYALKDSLRRKADAYYTKYLGEPDVQQIGRESNVPNAILTLSAADLQKLSENGAVDGFRFMQLNQVITAFTDHMGKCERIRNTVFPTSYVYFTKFFIWILVIFTTMILSSLVGVWSILIGWVVGFIFHVTHQNGMSLMEPFDEIPAGIPLNQIARTIEINLLQMLDEKEVPEPVRPVNDEYYL